MEYHVNNINRAYQRNNRVIRHHYQANRITFWLNGEQIVYDIPPAMTTMDYLHQELNLWGTKCSCNEGDCGACTVVIAQASGMQVEYLAINSCLYPAAKLHGKHLITIEGLGSPDDLHPIQQALLDFHGTQCGYCTPGFVMSMFALFGTKHHPSREEIMAALEGNLCRCTGYMSILEAAQYLSEHFSPDKIVPQWCRVIEPNILSFKVQDETTSLSNSKLYLNEAYCKPHSLEELFVLLDSFSDKEAYRIVSGGTDIMVQININRRKYRNLIDISGISELNGISIDSNNIHIGANTTYSQLLASEIISSHLPALQKIISQLASQQIRNFATLSGNIGNASPIADTAPLLLSLNAKLKLATRKSERIIDLTDYYLDYKITALQPQEIIHSTIIPIPPHNVYIDIVKSAKRKAVDIASVTTAIYLETTDNRISTARYALGGVDKIPRLSLSFAEFVINKEIDSKWFESAAEIVCRDFNPISDVRSSREQRLTLVHNHTMLYLNALLNGQRS